MFCMSKDPSMSLYELQADIRELESLASKPHTSVKCGSAPMWSRWKCVITTQSMAPAQSSPRRPVRTAAAPCMSRDFAGPVQRPGSWIASSDV